MKFPFFWNRTDQSKQEFRRSKILNEQISDASQNKTDPAVEYAEQLGRSGLFVTDDRVMEFLEKHSAFNALIPAFSPVNRTTKHIGKQDAKIAWLDNQILFTMLEMAMSPEDYEDGAMEILQGFEIFGNTQISDGYEGWKGRTLTQQVKIIRSEEANK